MIRTIRRGLQVRSELARLTPGHSARTVKRFVRSLERVARHQPGVTSNDLLVLAVEALRAVDRHGTCGPAIDGLMERVDDGIISGISDIPLNQVLDPDLAGEVVFEALREFRTDRLSAYLLEEGERQHEEEADRLLKAEMEVATGVVQDQVAAVVEEPILLRFPCLIRNEGEGELATPSFLIGTEKLLYWATSRSDDSEVHTVLRYQCAVSHKPDDEADDDLVEPWDLEDDEVAIRLQETSRRQIWSAPVRLQVVRKRRDDWGNELVVQVEKGRVDELLDLIG